MVMQRALLTWFVLLVFLILLSLRLETRAHWNWFLIFMPMWFYDFILCMYSLFNIFIRCKREPFSFSLFKNRNIALIGVVFLKVAAQIILCLKLEYPSLQLTIFHVLIPLWVMLPILILDVTKTLFRTSGSY